MRMMKWAWVAVVAWAAAAGAWAQPYMVPVGTNSGWTGWWVTKPGTNELDNWEGWYTQNTNWGWVQSRIGAMVSNNHTAPVTLHSVTTTTGGITNNGGAWTYGDGIHNIGGVQIDDSSGGELIIPNGNMVVKGAGMYYGRQDGITNAAGESILQQIKADGLFNTNHVTWALNNLPANAIYTAGIVSAPGAAANKVWKTDGSGNPAWRDESAGGITMADVRNQGMVTNSHTIPVLAHSFSSTTGGFTNNGGAWTYGDGIHNIGGVQIDDSSGGELIIPNGNMVVKGAGMYYGRQDGITNAAGESILQQIKADGLFNTNHVTWALNNLPVNAIYTAGIVSAPGAAANKVWKTDGSGNPAWRDESAGGITMADVRNQGMVTNSHTIPVLAHSFSSTTGGFTNNGGAWTYGDGVHNIGGVKIDDAANGEMTVPGALFVSGGAYITSTNAAYVGTDSNGKLISKSAPSSASVWEFNVSRTISGASPTPIYTNAWTSGPDYRKMVNYRIIGKAATSGSMYIRDEPVVHHASYGVLHDTYADVEQDLGSGGMQVTVTSNSVGLVWTVTGLAGENVAWRLVGTSDGYWASQ